MCSSGAKAADLSRRGSAAARDVSGDVPIPNALVRVLDVRTGSPPPGVPDPAATTRADGSFAVNVPPEVLVQIIVTGTSQSGRPASMSTLLYLEPNETRTGEQIDAASKLAAALLGDAFNALIQAAGTDAPTMDLCLPIEEIKQKMRQYRPANLPDFATASPSELPQAAIAAAQQDPAPVPQTLLVTSSPSGARCISTVSTPAQQRRYRLARRITRVSTAGVPTPSS